MLTPNAATLLPTAVLAAVVSLANPSSAAAPSRGPTLPEIRIVPGQAIPACVMPDRLMRFIGERNLGLEPRFRDIARHYKAHGEALGIRWDYAFFQMVLETNYLTFRRGNGDWGDVRPRQNNFAGIGATGGGVPGDSFPDVSTGVLAQMQHLLAYSGQHVAAPVAPRTREKQGDIIESSRSLRRPVRFSDLTNRWAADRNYARSIEVVAERYRAAFCGPGSAPVEALAPPMPAEPWQTKLALAGPRPPHPALPTPPAPKPARTACDVWSASYGGTVALLIRSASGATINYTVLQVEAGQEQPQTDAFIQTHARNGQTIARYASREEAFARAFELCPGPS